MGLIRNSHRGNETQEPGRAVRLEWWMRRKHWTVWHWPRGAPRDFQIFWISANVDPAQDCCVQTLQYQEVVLPSTKLPERERGREQRDVYYWVGRRPRMNGPS